MSKFVILLAVLCLVVLAVEAHKSDHREEKPKPTPAEIAAKKARREHRKKKILHIIGTIFKNIFAVEDFPDQDLDFNKNSTDQAVTFEDESKRKRRLKKALHIIGAILTHLDAVDDLPEQDSDKLGVDATAKSEVDDAIIIEHRPFVNRLPIFAH
ncbi:hypothetical protein KR018_012014 [Drosophila ironensis]|nr:hypothetical protein KR018_012014 [Drosophila ironensis]